MCFAQGLQRSDAGEPKCRNKKALDSELWILRSDWLGVKADLYAELYLRAHFIFLILSR